ncbi:Protein ROOT PRIMORDIUM DEFECTIVE 1 [Capsicum chinense]|nr:Protein ROOT PRIMORDIUM DEFECTIVE 1 [Capsicum annuum]KAF3672993.1 Protein ROOT PRIMORDIUM DEFECTIVE 1 [Capsicum annuum]PHU14974.1 Protein ROOT PRIMORDIUM DEFECTIVE 1 [Capsicum chinense]
MHIFHSISTKLSHSKSTFKSLTLFASLFLQSPKQFSQSTSIPKKQQRIRDHGFDDYMEVEKKNRKVIKFQDLLLTQPNSMIAISRLDMLARRFGFKQYEAGKFILKFPHVFEVFEHPVQRILYCRLTRKSLLQIEQEKQALLAQLPLAVTRLRKLLMLSNTGRLRLEHVRIARREFGLPDDFEYSVVLKYPDYFRLFDAKETRNKYIEAVERDPGLTVCAVESVREREYREKGGEEENVRFSFRVNFPPGFRIGKYYKIAVWKWQRLPYWLPYEDVSGYDLRSLEAQKRMEKRAVATIHELLSLTVEKKITLERIAHFRLAMDLPKKLKDFLLQHQGIFYISTRGNHGKLHTVFLREAYKKGELIVPNDLYLARRKLAELVLMSPRKAIVDRRLVNYRKQDDNDEIADHVENGGDHSNTQETVRQDSEEESMDSDEDCNIYSYDDCSINSGYAHKEVNNDDVTDDAEDTRVTE